MKKINYHQVKKPPKAIMLTLIIAFVLAGCPEEVKYSYYPDENPDSQSFRIGPQASLINAFDGLISIEIPADAVSNNAILTITKGLKVSIDSLLLSTTSFAVRSKGVELQKPITVELYYDPLNLDCKDPFEESCLRIYSWGTGTGEDQFLDEENMAIACGTNCYVDCTNKLIRACFNSFGTFVVGIGR